jgi:hAT family C-terminal dimerisation region
LPPISGDLESAKGNYPARKSKHIHANINNALTKLREYFDILDASPAYAVSLVLNPAIKVCFLDEGWEDMESGNWDPGPKTKERISASGPLNTKIKWRKSLMPSPRLLLAHQKTWMYVFQKFLYKRPFSGLIADEYSTYCNTNPLPEEPADLIRHWDGQAISSPSLSQMTLDLLSIPAMAAECERVFSSSKILISDHQNSLADDVIKANGCVRYWTKRDHFD